MHLDGVKNQLPEGVATAWISSLPRSSIAASPDDRMVDATSIDKAIGHGQFRMGARMAQWTFLSLYQHNSFLGRSVGLHPRGIQQKVETAFSKTKS
ncbi:hypothetical protein [Mesorhizobium huakuii]|uniref:Uncharacterized protein n=1 Tax=Mesorhizobium huakuii TaxID=28104 RepID=A0ABZ0VUD6_9HYPH|nr:hypothetical protein [Mesorhizobium huakuii]WQC00424.1 hypothetical protein U0R22_004629 [Mesorhizobium huakuii]